MPAKLTQPIGLQNYQLVTAKIFDILSDELPSQSLLTGSDVLNAEVVLERITPANTSEYPMVSVRYVDTNTENTDYDGDYLATSNYLIECYVSAKYSDDDSADTLVNLSLQRLTGVIRSILMASVYNKLDLPNNIVRSRKISRIAIGEPENNSDSLNVGYAQIQFEVVTNEGSERVSPSIIESYYTSVLLSLTDKGYTWDSITQSIGGLDLTLDTGLN